MKKIFISSLIIFSLVSCWEDIAIDDVAWNINFCNSPYEIWEVNKSTLNLKWVVINDELKTISSPMAWVVGGLNCEAWKKVDSNTLIAQISPDFNNPSIINLSIQKWSLINQKTNLESIKSSTIYNFDSQISDLKEQIIITENNIELTKKSSNLNKNDLEKQIKSSEDTLINLESNLELLKKAKTDALEKINISRESLFTNMNSISGDNLLKIDETFGITIMNRDLNDKYEDYLSAKNSSLWNEVEIEFVRLNTVFKNIDNLSDAEISVFLWDLVSLDELTRDSIKESIVNITFPQTQVDSLYLMFLTYSNNLADIKNWWDSLDNSISSTTVNYDTQILSLQNQIDSTKTNLENLQTNKLDNVDVWLDLQLSTFDSWLKTLNTNLSNLLSTKDSQVLGLDNQILQVEQSINSLNTSLSNRNIYANISWIVKQKLSSNWNNVGINTPICQILPDSQSTKIKIYSPVELSMWDKLIFDFNDELYEIKIENVLVYKDPITQNYVYESNYLDQNYFKDGEILSLHFENENILLDEIVNSDSIKDINIPVSYVKNRINWNFVKAELDSWIKELEVELWDINWTFVEIKEGLEGVNNICR